MSFEGDFFKVIFEPVKLEEFVERKCGERRAEHRGERGQVKEAEKSSEIGNRVSRKIVPWGQFNRKRLLG